MIAIPSAAPRAPRLGFLGVGRAEMARHLGAVPSEPGLARSLAKRGLETIRARHTCAHRVDALMAVLAEVR